MGLKTLEKQRPFSPSGQSLKNTVLYMFLSVSTRYLCLSVYACVRVGGGGAPSCRPMMSAPESFFLWARSSIAAARPVQTSKHVSPVSSIIISAIITQNSWKSISPLPSSSTSSTIRCNSASVRLSPSSFVRAYSSPASISPDPSNERSKPPKHFLLVRTQCFLQPGRRSRYQIIYAPL